MDSYEQAMLAYLKKQQVIKRGDRIVLGVSGGIDSMVLLHFLAHKRRMFGIEIAAAHLDHMLRGEESAADRQFVEQQCALWGVPCYSSAISIPAILDREGGNKQQVCRNERYRLFEEIMEKTGSHIVMTAHHADDQLETILMDGIRGSLKTGSFGMRIKRPFGTGFLVRPQLAVTKAQIARYAEVQKVPYREDSSNASVAYTRNRIRQTVVPILEKENPDAALHFAELSEQVNEDQSFLRELAAEALDKLLIGAGQELAVSAESFRSHAPALQKRMVLLLLNYLYDEEQVPITSHLAEQVRELLQSSSGTVFLHLPKNYMMRRQYDQVFFGPAKNHSPDIRADIAKRWSESLGGVRYRVMASGEEAELGNAVFWYFQSEESNFCLRGRKPGDRIQLAGMNRPKKLARLMIDEKVPADQRERWPVIVAGEDDVLLVPGLRSAACLSQTKRAGDNRVLVEQCIDHANEEET